MTARNPDHEVESIAAKSWELGILLIAILGVAASLRLVLASDETGTPSKWPPDAAANEARENLRTRKDALDALALKVVTSPYVMVSHQKSGSVSARRADSEENDVESSIDTDVWSELLTAAGFKFVLRNKDEVHFSNINEDTVLLDGVLYSYLYIWSEEYETLECLPDYAEFRCGQCGERHGNNWTIEFGWMPADISEWSEKESDQCIGEFMSARDRLSVAP